MTIEQFKEQPFISGMLAEYKGEKYEIISVNFDEALIGLVEVGQDIEFINWVRCENCNIII